MTIHTHEHTHYSQILERAERAHFHDFPMKFECRACPAGTWARTELFPELAARWREPVTRHEAAAVDARPIEHVREAARGR